MGLSVGLQLSIHDVLGMFFYSSLSTSAQSMHEHKLGTQICFLIDCFNAASLFVG